MPYNFVADSIHTKKNFEADFLQAKCDVTPKTAVVRFKRALGVLRTTYDDHHKLIDKRTLPISVNRKC